MNTKKFVSLFIVAISIFSFNPAVHSETIYSDVVIVAATPAGVAAAVSAARSGLRVVVLEETAHVGGIITGGLTNADIITKEAIRGIFEEYLQRIRNYYIENYGKNSPEYSACRNGYHVEPKVAEQVFREMLASEKQIHLIEKHRVVTAIVTEKNGREHPAEPGHRCDGIAPNDFGNSVKLTAVIAKNMTEPNSQTEFRAKIFVDATYEGDLAALAGVPYRVGRESREMFGEKFAGKVYVRFGEKELLPGSTGEADNGIQAFCFRFHMTKNKDRFAPVVKPDDYRRDDYRHLMNDFKSGNVKRLHDLIQIHPMPGGNFEINSNHPDSIHGIPSESLDLAEENWGWPEASPEERAKFFKRNWNHNEGLIWFLQHDPEVPEFIRKQALEFGFPTNEFQDNNYRPHHLYVRQGRRIWGEYNFTEKDADADPVTGLARRHPQGIAVAEFPIDSHGVTKFDPKHPGVREGYFYISHPPTQIPYGVLVPKRVDGLLVPVACSTTHVGYQMIRVEPTFMALGQATGIAAAEAIRQGKEVREINVKPVQHEIIKQNGIILFEQGKPVIPDSLVESKT
ncbi:MAG: FAD-dependent oxidoreductase [Planctomycetaceae bacterium]|nr:FAD-dependent oxidoreductase [Planctomycetaceae bacterium]